MDSNDKMALYELVEFCSNDNISHDLNVIKNSMSEISDILESIESLSDEYYNFLAIRRMIEYIIDDSMLFHLHSGFIEMLFSDFSNLIHQKLNVNSNRYPEYYGKFLSNLENHKDFFYANIFEFSHEYDDLIVDVTRVLWGCNIQAK